MSTEPPSAFSHHVKSLNGCRWHFVVEGNGPLLILLHGFPYSWFEFRRMIQPLAREGFRVVAPDLPGYGASDCPEDLSRHTHIQLVGDLVALVQSLGATTAMLAGHDVGSSLAFAASQMRPDVFTALALLNTPQSLRSPTPPRELWDKLRAKDGQIFYQEYFTREEAIAELDRDLGQSLRSIQFSISGAATGEQKWRAMMAPHEGFLDTVRDPHQLPPWMTSASNAEYVDQYRKNGFKGALAPYRCREINWRQTAFLSECRPLQPALFLGGEHDPANERFRVNFERLEEVLPRLERKHLIPGAGHSLPEEACDTVLDELIPFFKRHLASNSSSPELF